VKIIHAFDSPYLGSMYPSLDIDQVEEMKDEFKLQAMQKLTKFLTTALARVPHEDVPYWEFHVRYGSPRIVIEKAVKKADTDLLVLGTHGHSGLMLMFIGTVAGDILRNVDCDVLVVPPRQPNRK
jgi:nucleotide-binding universal stress UspA family protein